MTGGPSLPSLGPRGEGWVVGQGILLVLIAVLGLPGLAELPPTDATGWLRLGVGLAILGAGAVVGLAGLRALGPSLTAMPRPKPDAALVESGVYGVIRHPLYLAVFMAGLGWAVATASAPAAIAAVLLGLWLDAKARREERWLADAFLGYAAYRRRTRRFVPGLY